jgi:hypothetical protein
MSGTGQVESTENQHEPALLGMSDFRVRRKVCPLMEIPHEMPLTSGSQAAYDCPAKPST